MNIAEQLQVLAEIGLIDQKINNQNIVLKTVSSDAEQAKSQIKILQEKKDNLLSQIYKLKKEKKCKDDELEKEKQNLRKWLHRAERIRGEREFVALMSEISIKKNLINDTETIILEKMLRLEEIDKKLINITKDYKIANVEAEKKWSEIKVEMIILEQILKKEKKARLNLIEKLPSAIVDRYRRISAQRKGVGIAFLKCEVCECCKRMVPPELFMRVVKGEVLESCPSCQRLLVATIKSYSKIRIE